MKNGKPLRAVALLAWALVIAFPALAGQSLPKGMFEVHHEKGTIAGTNDPSINPNSGSTSDWRKMPRRQP